MSPGIYLINFVFLYYEIKIRAYIICKLNKKIDSYGVIYDSISFSVFSENSKKIISRYRINYLNKSYIFSRAIEYYESSTEEIFINRMFLCVLHTKKFRVYRSKLISYSITKLL